MIDKPETVQDVFNDFPSLYKDALYRIIGTFQLLNDDQLRVASFLIKSAIEDEARKRVQNTS